METQTTDGINPMADEPTESERLVLGVASELAATFERDPLWLRIAFVLLGLVSGLGVLLYLALWFALRAEGAWARRASMAVLVFGPPFVLMAAGFDVLDGPLAVIALLIGLAGALWLRGPNGEGRQHPAPAMLWSPPDTSTSTASQSTSTAIPGASAELAALVAATDSPSAETQANPAPAANDSRRRPPRPCRQPSMLGRAGLGAAILVGALWALLDSVDGGRLHPQQWFGAAAAVCGAAMLIGVVWGRARWLIIPALFFAGAGYVGGVTSDLGIPVAQAFGDHWLYVSSSDPATNLDRVSAGIGQVNATFEPRPDDAAPISLDLVVAFGRATLDVFEGDRVEVRIHQAHGDLEVYGGFETERVDDDLVVARLGGSGTPELVVDVRMEAGTVRLTTQTFEPFPEFESTVDSSLEEAGVPGDVGSLIPVDEQWGISATADGWFVIGYGSGASGDSLVVVDPDDEVITGTTDLRPDGTIAILSDHGEFRLLPRSLLMLPDQQVLDLRALRATLAENQTSPAVTEPAPTPTERQSGTGKATNQPTSVPPITTATTVTTEG